MKYTEIIFIIDASGSMAHLTGDTIGGFNGFIESQKALDGKATLTTVLFDNEYEMITKRQDVNWCCNRNLCHHMCSFTIHCIW